MINGSKCLCAGVAPVPVHGTQAKVPMGVGSAYTYIYMYLVVFSFIRNPQARGLLLIIGVCSVRRLSIDRRCDTLYGVWNGIGRGSRASVSCTLIHAKKIHCVVYGKWEITRDGNAGTNIQE